MSSKPDPNVRKLRTARRALQRNSAAEQRKGITHETDRYLRLNGAVIDAEKRVPWWRR